MKTYLLFLLLIVELNYSQYRYEIYDVVVECQNKINTNDLNKIKFIVNSFNNNNNNYNFQSFKKPILYFCKDFREFNSITKENNNVFAIGRSDRIYFQSLKTLEIWNKLESVIVHELVHFHFENYICKLPIWLKETIAIGISDSYYGSKPSKSDFLKLDRITNFNNYQLKSSSVYKVLKVLYQYLFTNEIPNLSNYCKISNKKIFEIIKKNDFNKIETDWYNYYMKVVK